MLTSPCIMMTDHSRGTLAALADPSPSFPLGSSQDGPQGAGLLLQAHRQDGAHGAGPTWFPEFPVASPPPEAQLASGETTKPHRVHGSKLTHPGPGRTSGERSQVPGNAFTLVTSLQVGGDSWDPRPLRSWH